MSDNNKVDRPIFVTIIGILSMIIGILTLFVGIAIAIGISIGGMSFDDDITGLTAIITGIVITCLALIYIVVGYGILKGWRIMWYLGVIFTILGIVLGILSFPVGIIFTIIEIVILYYLFRPGVKTFFNL